MDQHITTPITEEVTKKLHSGDYVYITGTIYVARDAAHKRMIEALDRGDQLPIDIKDATIYYMGPSPAREGRPIGSAGPTTATRMDKYAPTLLDLGEKAMIVSLEQKLRELGIKFVSTKYESIKDIYLIVSPKWKWLTTL